MSVDHKIRICIGCFSLLVTEYQQTHLSMQAFIVVHGTRIWSSSITVGKAWWQEHEVSSHIVSAAREQTDKRWCSTPFLFVVI